MEKSNGTKKRFIFFIILSLLLMIVVTFTACGNKDAQKQTEDDEQSKLLTSELINSKDVSNEDMSSETTDDESVTANASVKTNSMGKGSKVTNNKKSNNEEVNSKVVNNGAENSKEKIEAPKSTSDFALTVSAEKTTISQGENFKVHVALKSTSGKDQQIAYDFLFWPSIPNWNVFDDWGEVIEWPMIEPKIFKANSTIKEEWLLGSTLEPGTHELKFSATFYLNWGKENQQKVVFHKTVMLTVIKAENSKEDFILTISAEETTISQGENFKVIVELKNNSGKDQKIAHNFLFWPSIPDWHLFDDWGVAIEMPECQIIMFEKGSILQNIGVWGYEVEAWIFGAALEPGMHELKFIAVFYLNWGQEDQMRIEVHSNPIILTVL